MAVHMSSMPMPMNAAMSFPGQSDFSANAGISQQQLSNDPCLSSPCMFGRICKAVPPTQDVSSGFLCLNEIDANKDISDARVVYRNMEMLAKEAVLLNVATIQNHGQPPLSTSSQQQQLINQQQQQQQIQQQPQLHQGFIVSSPQQFNEQHVMLNGNNICFLKMPISRFFLSEFLLYQ